MVRTQPSKLGGRAKPNKASVTDYKDTVTRDVTQVDWPGTEKKVGLMILNCDEVQRCHLDARAWFRSQGQEVDLFSADELTREEHHQMVWHMLVAPESRTGDGKVFGSVGELRKQLTPDELAYFLQAHNDRQVALVKGWGFEPADSDDLGANG